MSTAGRDKIVAVRVGRGINVLLHLLESKTKIWDEFPIAGEEGLLKSDIRIDNAAVSFCAAAGVFIASHLIVQLCTDRRVTGTGVLDTDPV